MKNANLKLILLELEKYLLEMFEIEGKCRHTFKHTEWYLHNKCAETERQDFLELLEKYNIDCDCKILTEYKNLYDKLS